jgi:hypothetical protein
MVSITVERWYLICFGKNSIPLSIPTYSIYTNSMQWCKNRFVVTVLIKVTTIPENTRLAHVLITSTTQDVEIKFLHK